MTSFVLLAFLAAALEGCAANGEGKTIDPNAAALIMQMNQQNRGYQAPTPYQMPTRRNSTTDCMWITPTQMSCNNH